MELTIQPLRKKDYADIIQYAIRGMHFNWYMEYKPFLNLYGRYFWYQELSRATQIHAAYYGSSFAGVVLLNMKKDPKRHFCTIFERLFVSYFSLMQKIFSRDGAGVYERANAEMRENYLSSENPDGEILFFCANPDLPIRGIGTFLLRELERVNPGQEVYLYTDSACTYQFYDHRDFICFDYRDISMKLPEKDVQLRCFLYRKRL